MMLIPLPCYKTRTGGELVLRTSRASEVNPEEGITFSIGRIYHPESASHQREDIDRKGDVRAIGGAVEVVVGHREAFDGVLLPVPVPVSAARADTVAPLQIGISSATGTGTGILGGLVVIVILVRGVVFVRFRMRVRIMVVHVVRSCSESGSSSGHACASGGKVMVGHPCNMLGIVIVFELIDQFLSVHCSRRHALMRPRRFLHFVRVSSRTCTSEALRGEIDRTHFIVESPARPQFPFPKHRPGYGSERNHASDDNDNDESRLVESGDLFGF